MKLTFKPFFLFFFSMLALSLYSCKERCKEETWSIEGRLIHGTTKEPIKNVFFTFELFDYSVQELVKNRTPIGHVITDDSGRFKFEYPCQGKDFEKISVRTEAPYSGYVREDVDFSRHYVRTFYYATEGTHRVILKPAKPLGEDTLFVGLRENWTSGTAPWIFIDTFSQTVPEFWKEYRQTIGGGRTLFVARGQKLFKAITGKSGNLNDYYKYSSLPFISGDPVIDSSVVYY